MKAMLARVLAVALTGMAAGVAMAEGLPMVEDADASGSWSMAELQTVWADLTEDGFKAVDANGDGAVDATELQAAWDNGVLKPVGG